MSTWLYRCDIKQHFNDEDNGARFEATRDAIVAELMTLGFFHEDSLLQTIALMLHLSEDADEFNVHLGSLYEWADDERVWLG